VLVGDVILARAIQRRETFKLYDIEGALTVMLEVSTVMRRRCVLGLGLEAYGKPSGVILMKSMVHVWCRWLRLALSEQKSAARALKNSYAQTRVCSPMRVRTCSTYKIAAFEFRALCFRILLWRAGFYPATRCVVFR
jgi:hypothetical protein